MTRVWQGGVFDFDGVLIDSSEVYRQALSEKVAPVSRSDWPRLYGMTTVEAVQYAAPEPLLPRAADDIATGIDDRVAELLAASPPARPGAVQVLELLSRLGLPLAIASSASRRAIDATLEALAWRHYFAVVIGREDTEQTKPAPDPYRNAAFRLGLDPGACFAVEDTDIGIRSAHDAGMFTIALGGTQSVGELACADLYFEDFTGWINGDWFRLLLSGHGDR